MMYYMRDRFGEEGHPDGLSLGAGVSFLGCAGYVACLHTSVSTSRDMRAQLRQPARPWGPQP